MGSANASPSPPIRFDGRVALLTGAATGIGEAAARTLAALGGGVAIADLDLQTSERLAHELREDGSDAVALACDVADAGQVRAATDAALAHFGQIDVLVNAAGGFKRRIPTWEMEEAEWDEVLASNLTGTFLVCRSVLPQMIDGGYGRIVNVASGAGRATTHISGSHYAASKAGVLGLTRHLAREVAGHGITVNAIAPGTTLTARIEDLYTEERREEIAREIPIGRLGLPADSAGAVAFLASESAAYITGVTLDVVGGRYLI